jgi:hypothetical protein
VNNNFIKLLQEILTTSKTPEEYNARLDELADKLKGSEQAIKYIDDLHRIGLAQKAKEFSPAGFLAHYELISGIAPPRHVKRWTGKVFRAHDNGKGFVLRAFRGSWKTTTWGVLFVSYVIAHSPILTNVVVSANDDSAEKITKAVAATIEYHPEWKRAYPSIVPDKDRGWSVEGFFVKDTSIPYDEWTAKRSTIIDPTLVGGGIGSTRINGKHPSGVLYCDDVHDLHNSSSDKERKVIVKTMTSVVLKTAIRRNDKLETWVFGVGVPWAEDDALEIMANSGQYDSETLPAMRKATPETPGATYVDGINRITGKEYSEIKGWWVLEWPEHYGVLSVLSDRALGKSDFWQMIMMDIKTAKTGGLKYHSYPYENIDPTWIYSGGVDFATLGDGNTNAEPDPGRDMFSIAYGGKTAFNQLVVTSGIIEQCTQAQAEEHMKNSHSKFTNWRTGIFEGDGAGEQFWLSFIQRNKGARWRMEKTGGKAKRYRQEKEMGPWLENAAVLISDEDTPYLNDLRKALEDFPDGNNDIRDGLYWLCRSFPEVLILPTPPEGESLPKPGQKPMGLQSAWSQI